MNILLAPFALQAGGFDNAPLFAARGGELIGLVMFILIFLVPLLGQILSKMKAPPPKGAARPARPARPAASASVQTEIEEFLRRANQKKAAPVNRPARPQPIRPMPGGKPVRAEVVRAEVVRERPVGGEVEKHVKKYLDQEEFARRSKKLGEDVAEADDKIEKRLKSVFDHSLSKIAATPGETAAPPAAKLADAAPQVAAVIPAAAVGDIAALFGNPASIRQAVILSEILNRPLERW